MNATSASPADLGAAPATPTAAPSRRTVDAPTRAFHWLTALCFAGAYATADGERWRLVDELCRVADRYVLIDYAAPLALGALGARLRGLGARNLHGARTYRTCSLASLREKFARHGFLLHADRARQPLVHPQHIASFRRL